ncbi:MAG TPA: DUF2569 family protein [Thermoanaerobaculia bacterium]|nr:DUF2569 family protein [Thermoanaerobaculia bacterium]
MNEDTQVIIYTLLGVAVWAAAVIGGIRLAKRKSRSPHWMWFGLHPVGALIVLIVMAVLKPLKRCPQCSHKLPPGAHFCSACRYDLIEKGPTGAGVLTLEREPTYTSVGGWLLFLCVGLTILSPLVNGGRLLAGLSSWDQISTYSSLANIVAVEAIFGFALIAFGVFAGISLWTLSPNGVTMARRFFIAVLCYQGLMVLMVFGTDLPYFAKGPVQEAIMQQVVASGIGVAIWWSYLNKSKRVADLFSADAQARRTLSLDLAVTSPPRELRAEEVSRLQPVMQTKSTEELEAMLHVRDTQTYTPETFAAIELVLKQRGGSVARPAKQT